MASSARSRSSPLSSNGVLLAANAPTVVTVCDSDNPVHDDAKELSRDGDEDSSSASEEDGWYGFHSGDKFQTSALTTSDRTSCRLQAGPLPFCSAMLACSSNLAWSACISCFSCSATSIRSLS